MTNSTISTLRACAKAQSMRPVMIAPRTSRQSSRQTSRQYQRHRCPSGDRSSPGRVRRWAADRSAPGNAERIARALAHHAVHRAGVETEFVEPLLDGGHGVRPEFGLLLRLVRVRAVGFRLGGFGLRRCVRLGGFRLGRFRVGFGWAPAFGASPLPATRRVDVSAGSRSQISFGTRPVRPRVTGGGRRARARRRSCAPTPGPRRRPARSPGQS
jgi:hypothetical protein